MPSALDDVARYYEANTRRFLRFGVGRSARVLHRPVWANGARSRRQALRGAHERRREHQVAESVVQVAFGALSGGALSSFRWSW